MFRNKSINGMAFRLELINLGFSITELLVVLTIFCCLSLVVIPSYFDLHNRQNVGLKAWEIKRSLELARSVAVAEYRSVKACPADENDTCVSGLGKRFLVFGDSNADDQWNSDEPIYKSIAIGGFNVRLSATGRPFIRFKSSGEAMESGNVMICNPLTTDYARQVIVFVSGRIRVSEDTDADGYDEKSAKAINCV